MSYGDTFAPQGVTDEIKVRGPVWVGLWSITGFYAIYWVYVTAKHLSAYGNAKGRDLGQNPTMTLLALTIGWIVLIPPIVAIYRQAKRIQQAQHLAGVQPMNGWLALVLYLVVSPVFFAYEQSELNKDWEREGGPVPNGDGHEAPRLDAAPATTVGAPVSTGATSGDPLAASPERPGA